MLLCTTPILLQMTAFGVLEILLDTFDGRRLTICFFPPRFLGRNLFLIAPSSDHCLLVQFIEIKHVVHFSTGSLNFLIIIALFSMVYHF